MATSERLRNGSFRALTAGALVVLVAACAQVTGLADDYRYDLSDAGDAATDGPAASDSGTTNDGSIEAGPTGDRCTAQERAQAQNAMVQANGDNVPAGCRSCLATSCCDEIAACAGNPQCEQSMECIFGCQKSGNKAPCLDNCTTLFAAQVGACIQRSCGAPTCQLQ